MSPVRLLPKVGDGLKGKAMSRFGLMLAVGAAGLMCGGATKAPFQDTLPLTKYLAQAKPVKGDLRISYGPSKSQYADLFLPKNAKGPIPVVILVHGGCWSAMVPAETTSANAADLARGGVAVWNIEYRRIGEPGGGYPGMYEDVGAAFDKLRDLAAANKLDLSRITVVGHSAGGHLGLWGAARAKLPAGHKLRGTDPLPVRAAINLGGAPDIEHAAELLPIACGPDTKLDAIIGAKSADRPDPFADTSVNKLLPLGIRTRSIMGEFDDIIPPYIGLWWQRLSTRKGDDVDTTVIKGAGHFDLVAVSEPEWQQVRTLTLAEAKR